MDIDALVGLLIATLGGLMALSGHHRSEEDQKLIEEGHGTDVLDDRYERRWALTRWRWPVAVGTALAFIGAGVGGGGVILGGGGPGPTGNFPTSYAAPATPTIDAAVITGDSMRLVGSAFSGDQDDTHDSTHFQVDTAGGAFSSPQYWNVRLGAVTTDTVTALDSASFNVSRVRYRGTNGGWSAWSSSVQTEMALAAATLTTGTIAVFDQSGDSARVSGEGFSGTSHDSTHIQVDTLGGGWASLNWDVKLGAVTTDTVIGLDSAAVYMARVRYKDNGTWQAYQDSMTFAAGFGPEAGPNEPAGFSRNVGRARNSKASTDSDRGTGSFPWKWGGAEGWNGTEWDDNKTSVVVDPSSPFSPPNVWAWEYTEGSTPEGQSYNPGNSKTEVLSGVNGGLNAPNSYVQIYHRFTFRLGPNYDTNSNTSVAKLVFYKSGNDAVNGPYLQLKTKAGGFELQMDMQATEEADPASPNYTGTTVRSASTAHTIVKDTWYEVEAHLQMQDTIEAGNGEINIWLKEHPSGTRTKIFSYANVYLRDYDDTDSSDVFSSVFWAPVWGGQNGTRATTFYLYTGHDWVTGKETYN